MTVRCDLLQVLRVFARFTGNRWGANGKKVAINCPVTTKRQDRALRNCINRMEAAKCRAVVRWVDVSGDDVCVLHRTLWYGQLVKYARKAFTWQMRQHDLPILIRYRGLLYVWNGTHRMTLCRLSKRRLRARLFNYDIFLEWKRAHRGNRKRTLS